MVSAFARLVRCTSGGNTRLIAPALSNFGAHMEGWKIVVNTHSPVYHTILSVVGNDEVIVEGDLTDPSIRPLAQAGDWFRVITPYGHESFTGGAHADTWKHHPREGMWAGYRYMTAGAEGSYYCWNRTYDIRTGRWTTPDPAASPWWNLQDYVGGNPLGGRDESGLATTATMAGAASRATEYAKWADDYPTNAWLPCAKFVSRQVNNLVKMIDKLAHPLFGAIPGGGIAALEAAAVRDWLLGFGAELYKQAQYGIPLVVKGYNTHTDTSAEWRKAAEKCSGGTCAEYRLDPGLGGDAGWKLDDSRKANANGHAKACCEAMVEAEQAPGTAWAALNPFPPRAAWVINRLQPELKEEYHGRKLEAKALTGTTAERLNFAKGFCCSQEALDVAKEAKEKADRENRQ